MGNGRVLPVLAVEDQHLLVNENGSIIQVQNNIQRQVTPGDYVNVENTLGQDKAVGVAREDDPSGQHARVEKVTDDYILVQTNSRSRILANPAEDVSPGDGVLLTELGEFYKVFEDGIVELDDTTLDPCER